MMRSLICLIFLSFSLVGVSEEKNPPRPGSYFNGKKVDPPEREVAVILDRGGYYPKHIVAFKGERLRVFLTTLLPEEGCLNVPAKDVFLTARKGSITEGLFFFDKPGTYKFHCPTGKMEGIITVLARKASYETAKRLP